MPLAFQLQYAVLDKSHWRPRQDDPVLKGVPPAIPARVEYSHYAYLFSWADFYAPKALYLIQQRGIRTKVATEPFTDGKGRSFARGAILIPVQNQPLSSAALHEFI